MRLAQSYTIHTVAGTAPVVDGPAFSAELGLVGGVVVDPSGNLYVSLHTSHMVVKATPAGTLTRIAGSGQYGFGGDGGPALQAQIAYPQSLALDAAGNLYIEDGGNQRVRVVSPSGTISTFPGSPRSFSITQGIYLGQWSNEHDLPGIAALALFSGMAVTPDGSTIYVSDMRANQIMCITGGTWFVYAGTGDRGYNGDSIDADDRVAQRSLRTLPGREWQLADRRHPQQPHPQDHRVDQHDHHRGRIGPRRLHRGQRAGLCQV